MSTAAHVQSSEEVAPAQIWFPDHERVAAYWTLVSATCHVIFQGGAGQGCLADARISLLHSLRTSLHVELANDREHHGALVDRHRHIAKLERQLARLDGGAQ